MSNLNAPVPSGAVTDAENNIANKEVEGLSQGQIVRRRFLRHRGAVISMIVLAFIIILAFTAVGFDFAVFGMALVAVVVVRYPHPRRRRAPDPQPAARVARRRRHHGRSAPLRAGRDRS